MREQPGLLAAVSDAPVTTIRVTQELDLATTPALRLAVDTALVARPAQLTLDLSGCSFAGVDAVGLLVELTERAARGGTRLVLVGVRPVVLRVVRLLRVEGRLHLA